MPARHSRAVGFGQELVDPREAVSKLNSPDAGQSSKAGGGGDGGNCRRAGNDDMLTEDRWSQCSQGRSSNRPDRLVVAENVAGTGENVRGKNARGD